MAALRADPWRTGLDVPFIVFAVAVVASLVRSVDQPSLDVEVGGTTVAFVPTDVALAALAALCLARLLGSRSLPRPSWHVAAAAGAFSAWLLGSSALNGAEALVGAAKLLEYSVLALGAVLFVQRRVQLWALAAVLVATTCVGVAVGLVGFLEEGGRQESFLGPHDLAALSTMALAVGLAWLYAPGGRWRPLALVAGLAGAVGIALGAALAGLLGVYLAAGAVVAVARARGATTRRALAVTGLTLVAITAAVLGLRLGDFGVVGEDEDGGVAGGSWRQRLIYTYIGGRIFLENPVVGTGWHGELPPDEFARFLPDARAAFPDEPARYFPPPADDLIPQQTYDQVLFELGLVGAVLFLALGAIVLRTGVRVALSWPRGDADGALAYLPIAWTGSLAGAMAGAALFGGIPLAAIFWLTLGAVALAPSLVPRRPPEQPPPAPDAARLVAARE